MDKQKPLTKRRNPKRLSSVLTVYVCPQNAAFAKELGNKYFGGYSAYIDRLITDDRLHEHNKKWLVVSAGLKE